jgi:hypothetical protein
VHGSGALARLERETVAAWREERAGVIQALAQLPDRHDECERLSQRFAAAQERFDKIEQQLREAQAKLTDAHEALRAAEMERDRDAEHGARVLKRWAPRCVQETLGALGVLEEIVRRSFALTHETQLLVSGPRQQPRSNAGTIRGILQETKAARDRVLALEVSMAPTEAIESDCLQIFDTVVAAAAPAVSGTQLAELRHRVVASIPA